MGFGINHIFVFLKDQTTALAVLDECKLVANNSQNHPGQGTSSVQAYFDNAILELLWVSDEAEVGSRAVARTRLNERSRWFENGACPFGLGIYGRFPFPYWDYRSPAAPDRPVSVSLASDDPRQPFIFKTKPFRPDTWAERSGARQKAAGLTEIVDVSMSMSVAPAPAVKILDEMGFLRFTPSVAATLTLGIKTDQGKRRALQLPRFGWED